MNKKILALVAMMATILPVFSRTEYSKAGFFTVDGTGRTVASMNPAWRFHRGDVSGASDVDMIYSDKEAMLVGKGRLGMSSGDGVSIDPEQERSAREKSAGRLLEVERQQSEFGE
ncbi:MAG: hypothetical protein K2I34_06440 [Paramuribaculum sp.]|nr:hypothetical protein [Paramuribaculum sp.]